MKYRLIPLLLIFSLCLTGCGSRASEDVYARFSQELNRGGPLSFTGTLRCEYPDRTVNFRLRYERNGEQELVTVLEPEIVAGIRAVRESEGNKLEFEGLILDTGDLDPYGLSPMNALPLLVEALSHGHADSFWDDQGLKAVSLILDDHLSARVWFDEGMTPHRAELVSDKTVTAVCEITDWRLSNERSSKENMGGDFPAQFTP